MPALEFSIIVDPIDDIVTRIAELTPENPFYTKEYVKVRQRSGLRPCAIVLRDGAALVTGCLGFMNDGRVNSRLELTSLPSIPDKDIFWRGLFEQCRKIGITVLSVNTFASIEPLTAATAGRTLYKRRSEYRIGLRDGDLWEMMNRRHHRLVKKARSAGLSMRRSNDASARSVHVELANRSLNRRRDRGETIDYQISLDEVDAFVECGAGEIVQAVRDHEVFSSILIACSRTGAYAQSSGTSDAGRTLGSSHFLFHEVACLLRSEGFEVFNLGGADEESTGLQEFKLGLGSTRIDLESAEFYMGSRLKQLATRAAALLKNWTLPIGV